MKKVISIFLACCILIIGGVSTYAALPETIEPLWVNIDGFQNNIYFNGANSSATATVIGKSGTTKITGTLTVYRQSGSNWIYVGSDSDTVTTSAMGLSVNFTGYSEVNYTSVLSFSLTRNGVTESESNTYYKTCPKS